MVNNEMMINHTLFTMPATSEARKFKETVRSSLSLLEVPAKVT